ncbi:MAG: HAD family hydrolase [bacterium]|nr:HAD family hydrolase [bacterium]
MSGKAAVFFDRDGTLSRDVGYVVHLDDYELLPRAAGAVRLVNEAGLLAILVTNQAGVARGYFPEEMIGRVHAKLQEELGKKGAHLDAIYYCPSLPGSSVPGYDEDSDWRKPKPGMLLQAAEDHGVDLSRSFMVGDKYSDLVCGWAAGCKSAFVLTGYGRGEREFRGKEWPRQPDIVGEDAYHVTEMILDEMAKSKI